MDVKPRLQPVVSGQLPAYHFVSARNATVAGKERLVSHIPVAFAGGPTRRSIMYPDGPLAFTPGRSGHRDTVWFESRVECCAIGCLGRFCRCPVHLRGYGIPVRSVPAQFE